MAYVEEGLSLLLLILCGSKIDAFFLDMMRVRVTFSFRFLFFIFFLYTPVDVLDTYVSGVRSHY